MRASLLLREAFALVRFAGALALLLFPLLAILWVGAGESFERHPTRAVVLGLVWVVIAARLVFAGRRPAAPD